VQCYIYACASELVSDERRPHRRYVPPAGPLAPYSFSEAAGRLLLRELEHGRFQGDGFVGCTPLVAAGSFAVVTCRYDTFWHSSLMLAC